jgi:hypothetical protein
VPSALVCAGVIFAALIAVARDATWQAVWIGLASTCLTAGLVDGSALMEAARREGAILRLSREHVRLVRDRLRSIVAVTFASSTQDQALAATVRAKRHRIIDLGSEIPERSTPGVSRLLLITRYIAEMDEALRAAVGFGVLTSEANRFQELDAALRANIFLVFIRVASVAPQFNDERGGFANSAAEALDTVNLHLGALGGAHDPPESDA